MATTERAHNLSVTVLSVFAGLAWLIAFMLWIVLAQVTDYATYDVNTAAALMTWIVILVLSGIAAVVGAVVVSRVVRKRRLVTRG